MKTSATPVTTSGFETDPARNAGRGSSVLATATGLQHEAATEGFDWDGTAPVLAKIEEELAELREAITQGPDRVRDEFGDLLFVLVNLARHLRLDPAEALDQANAKFRRRYQCVLRGRAHWQTLQGADRLRAMEALWQQAKREER